MAAPHLLLLLAAPSLATNYCAITPRHTMCQYKGIGATCGSQILGRGVTGEERREIVDLHNKFRAKLARGEERRGRPGPQPGAADMLEMEWDNELANVAQRHADQCVFDHDCSECRSVDRWGVGQNLYIYKQSLRLPARSWKKALTDWYDEVRLFSRKHVKPFQFSAAIGHYSQMGWADTYKVGCGATSYREGKWFSTLYTCDYGPNGNFIRAQMYQQGRSCSACPIGTSCSSSYPGLCSSSKASPTFNISRPATSFSTTRRTSVFTTRRTTTTRRPTSTPSPLLTTTQSPWTVTQHSNSFPNSSLTSLLFSCEFREDDQEICDLRNTGQAWDRIQNTDGNIFYQTKLGFRDRTELFFKNTISPPEGGVACLDFKYRKFSRDGHKSSLQVVAWPFRGKPGKISVFRDSPASLAWVRAQITFRNIDNMFLVMFRAGGPATRRDTLHLALDQIQVLSGKCITE